VEKRNSQRQELDLPVVFTRFSTLPDCRIMEGVLQNVGDGGLCIETDVCLKSKTRLLVKIKNEAQGQCSLSETPTYRSTSIAEVRWTQELKQAENVRYGIGLKYF
jgi:hypothetical protein